MFGSDMSQTELYNSTAGPMLKSFVEGYNVTIMAYGQTGSGKTYTMGTSDAFAIDDQDMQGLIPRFVHDLYANLETAQTEESDCESVVRCSFLEIYGEDVYDLLTGVATNGSNTSTGIGTKGPNAMERPSMPVRENDQGNVFVQGLQEVQAHGADAALALLYEGTRNRITASTAMNSGSSRSHAVFTVTLEQTVHKQAAVGEDGEDAVLGGAHVATTTISKLTFVDLAGR